ncbi:hypothetical protein CASFOL_028684 [Castilleja foliolosa]|uniref:FAR1 domain-containing protein n=1 Tax=Castilleja foliolosa TaxID=1961234 RepID=A0ABD3CBY1_9LAMI
MQGQGDIEHDSVVGNDNGSDIYGDGEATAREIIRNLISAVTPTVIATTSICILTVTLTQTATATRKETTTWNAEVLKLCTNSGNRVKMHVSPKKTKYYTPECAPGYRPYIKQEFKTLNTGIDFYLNYASICGFDIRLGSHRRASDGTVIWKHVYCNREGEKNVPAEEISRARRRISRRSRCKALIAFIIKTGGIFVVRRFIEHHSHELCHESLKHLMKVNRKLNAGNQKFVMDCARENIGPTKSFRLYKETVGGYSKVGCTGVDFENFSRDLKAYASGVDAQMLLQNLFRIRETSPGFYFEYTVDASEHLTRLFWADTIGR